MKLEMLLNELNTMGNLDPYLLVSASASKLACHIPSTPLLCRASQTEKQTTIRRVLLIPDFWAKVDNTVHTSIWFNTPFAV
jgi:hypothetical protein